MTRLWTLLVVFLACSTAAVRADIYRWDNGEAIPGTEGIVLANGIDLSDRLLQYADLAGIGVGSGKFDRSDLSSARLTGSNFGKSSFQDAILHQADVRRANFYNASLSNADLSDALIEFASFRAVTPMGFTAHQLYSTASYKANNLIGVELGENDLSGWILSNQNLTGADFNVATLVNTNFSNSIVKSANFSRTTDRGFTPEQLYATASYQAHDLGKIRFDQTDLSGWNFDDQDMSGALLYEANFTGANLNRTNFTKAELNSTRFWQASLQDADFSNAYAPSAQFQDADMRRANLSNVDLASGGFFQGANLHQATLQRAHGRFVQFNNANFSDANLKDVKFELSTFTGANFSGASIQGAQLSGEGLTAEMLYSTASYHSGDLKGLRLQGNQQGWNFDNQDLSGGTIWGNIQGASFRNAKLLGTDLNTYEVEGADFTGARIEGAVIGQGWTAAMVTSTASYELRDLSGVRFNYIDAQGVDFSNFNLTGTLLGTGSLRNADFRGANLQSAEFGQVAFLDGAQFTGAKIRGVTFNRSTNVGLTFAQVQSTSSYTHGDLSGVKFVDCDLSNWQFEGFELEGAEFRQSQLAGANLRNANLAGASFYDARLSGTILDGANILGASFAHTTDRPFVPDYEDLTPLALYSTASYQKHQLMGVNFDDNDLRGWNFEQQNLTGAFFRSGDARGTVFRGAVLQNAQFRATKLNDADFRGADLRGAFAYSADGFNSATLTNAIQPDGKLSDLMLGPGDELVVRAFAPNPSQADQPTRINAQHSWTIGDGGELRIVLDSGIWNSVIAFEANIPVQLGGTLELTFTPDVDLLSQVGRTIRVFDWTGVEPTGAFTVASAYPWDLSELYTTGEITFLLPGDTNGDQAVTIADLNNVRNNFGAAGGLGDTNGDQQIDIQDLNNVRNFFGASTPQTVPEPSSLLLAALVAGGLVVLRRT